MSVARGRLHHFQFSLEYVDLLRLLKVPFFEDETLASFTSRMARANGRVGLNRFFSDLGLKGRRIGLGGDIDELADRLGMDADVLRSRSFKLHEDGGTEFGGDRFHRRMITRGRLRVCVECLADDQRDATRMPVARKYERVSWKFNAVKVCCKHHRMLTTLDVRWTRVPDFYRALEETAAEIADVPSEVERHPPTRFELFVKERMAGVREHGSILDNTNLPTAMDACHMFGMASLTGHKFHLRGAGEMVDREAMNVGFDLLREGEQAVMEVLDRLIDGRRKSAIASAKAGYGSLYFSLNQKERGQEYDYFRHLLRRHAAESSVLVDGTRLFNEDTETGLVPLTSITAQSGFPVQKFQRYVEALESREGAVTPVNGLVNVVCATRVLNILRASILVPDMSKLLGWSVPDCRRLIRLGIIRPIAARETGLMPRYSPDDVLAVKADLISRSIPGHGEMKSFAGKRDGSIDKEAVTKAIFDGSFKRFSYTEAERLDDALFYDPLEVLAMTSDKPLSLKEVMRSLHVSWPALSWLLDFGALPGLNREKSTVPRADVAAFQSRFVSSAEWKKTNGIRPGMKMGHIIDMCGVTPAFPVDEIGQLILRREDGPKVLQHVREARTGDAASSGNGKVR